MEKLNYIGIRLNTLKVGIINDQFNSPSRKYLQQNWKQKTPVISSNVNCLNLTCFSLLFVNDCIQKHYSCNTHPSSPHLLAFSMSSLLFYYDNETHLSTSLIERDAITIISIDLKT